MEDYNKKIDLLNKLYEEAKDILNTKFTTDDYRVFGDEDIQLLYETLKQMRDLAALPQPETGKNEENTALEDFKEKIIQILLSHKLDNKLTEKEALFQISVLASFGNEQLTIELTAKEMDIMKEHVRFWVFGLVQGLETQGLDFEASLDEITRRHKVIFTKLGRMYLKTSYQDFLKSYFSN